MIEDLDRALEQFLIRELPIKSNEIDIKFEQPKREWSARLSRPTLNLFLYDVRENKKLRTPQPPWEKVRDDGRTVVLRRQPVRLDLHYMVTAWAAEPEDEHSLLTRTLMTLFRYPHLPEKDEQGDLILPESLRDQPVPIPMMVAQYEEFRNPTDVWSVLDNEMRPAVALIITMALDPYRPVLEPVVRTLEFEVGQSPEPASRRLDEKTEPGRFVRINGKLRSDRPLEDVSLVLVEQGREVPIGENGKFAIDRIRDGDYTLEVSVKGGETRRHRITVPSESYDIVV